MNIRKSLMTGFLATSLALSGGMAMAQDVATDTDDDDSPKVEVALVTADGAFVGTASFEQNDDGVKIHIENSDNDILSEGWYGVHVHESGVCDTSGDFESAGGHFNPTGEVHGDLNADPSHAGDLGNMEVNEDGDFEHDITAEKLSMEPGAANSLDSAQGSAIIIHSGEDDLATDPSGESGDRFACGVIFPASDGSVVPAGSPVASPVTSPEATPAN